MAEVLVSDDWYWRILLGKPPQGIIAFLWDSLFCCEFIKEDNLKFSQCASLIGLLTNVLFLLRLSPFLLRLSCPIVE